MHDQAEILTIMQEWCCNFKAYAKFHLFFCCICALASLLCGLAVLTRQGDGESLVTCIFALIGSFIFFTLYKNKRHNIKQVRFTPEAVYIEGLKLDMSYLKSVEYITTLRNIHKDVIAIELSMTFFPNRLCHDHVHFYMEFGKNILFSNTDNYDYQTRFINVLQLLAKDRREQLKKQPNKDAISKTLVSGQQA